MLNQPFMTLGSTKLNYPAPVEKIREIEALIGFALPKAYKAFIAINNGGSSEFRLLTFSSGYEFCINNFFHISYEAVDSQDAMQVYMSRLGGAQGVFPIARDGGDNLLCIESLKGSVIYSVRFVDEKYINPVHVSNDFELLIGELQKFEDEADE